MAANGPELGRWSEAHGRRLREARIAKGMPQKEVAGILGVSDDTLRNWENGTTQPREASLAAVAEFCEIPLEELVRMTAQMEPPSPSGPAAYHPPVARRRSRWIPLLLASVTLVAVMAGLVGLIRWRRASEFKEIRTVQNGVEAISRSGQALWRAVGVDPHIAERWALVRAPGGRTFVATVLTRPGDLRPEAVSTLSLIDPNARQLKVVRRVQLPTTGWMWFPGYSRRYELAQISAVDLDDDGVDEILATYQQIPECVSYTILYEPAVDKARILFIHSGAHHYTGAWDLDGDGRRELLFLGINNGYNWMNALTAIRIQPWVGTPLRSDEYAILSPDSSAYIPRESAIVFFALLPRGKVPDDPGAVSWDPTRRLISVRLLNGRVVNLTSQGFLASVTSSRSEVERDGLRREAYRYNREARRLHRAGIVGDAVGQAREAVANAERAGDPIVTEAMQRDLAKILIAAGMGREGEQLGEQLALHSENASEIYYDIAVAFHLGGDLRRAVAYYELGIRKGGSPEAGKSKHEFILGETLALVELGAFAEAEQAIDRFRDRYVTRAEDWSAIYREFVTWRRGDMPNPSRVFRLWSETDLQRYWVLEFQNANGGDAAGLLRSADALLAESNQPRAALQSLRAVLLSKLGRNAEAANAAREAAAESAREVKRSVIARGHAELIARRTVHLSHDRDRAAK